MLAAEEQFALTYKRFLKSWAVITSFRQVAEAGLPMAEKVIALEYSQFVEAVPQTLNTIESSSKSRRFLMEAVRNGCMRG